jgi:hypothetical protein
VLSGELMIYADSATGNPESAYARDVATSCGPLPTSLVLLWTGNWDRPRLTLRGRWQNPDLVMNDGGTLSAAFLPDGRLYDGPPRNQPRAREPLPVVFHSGDHFMVAQS